MGRASLPLPEFLLCVASHNDVLHTILSLIPHLPLRSRKLLVDFSRIQPQPPLGSSRFYTRNAKDLDLVRISPLRPTFGEAYTLYSLLCRLLDGDPLGPVVYGLIAQSAICFPGLSDEEVSSTLSDSLFKEISASQEYNLAKLSYVPWLQEGMEYANIEFPF